MKTLFFIFLLIVALYLLFKRRPQTQAPVVNPNFIPGDNGVGGAVIITGSQPTPNSHTNWSLLN
jgi:hypothetical protein